ncbi:MAG: hypothetical protein ACFFDX_07305 [Candidatus Odinarchaeota archaeon]
MASKAGAIVGLIGGVFSLVMITLSLTIAGLGGGIPPPVWQLNIPYTLTPIMAIIIIIGAVLSLKGNKVGTILMLVFGVVALICSFIPIMYYGPPWGFIYLTYSCYYIDYALVILGGILDIILKRRG